MRLGRSDGLWPRWAEWAMAAGMLTLVAGAAAAGASPRPGLFVGLLLISASPWLAQAAGLPVPSLAYAVVANVPVIVINLAGDRLDLWHPGNGNSQAALMFSVFVTGQLTAGARWRDVSIAIALALTAAWSRWFSDPHYDAVVIWTVAVAVACMAGLIIRILRETIVELQDAQAQLRTQARAEERSYIAREIHDVIAHSLTVTMLHLGAARLAAERGDSTQLAEALSEAENAARTSLQDVRRTVGLLGTDAAAGAESPQPDHCDVGDLVDGYRAAGLVVDLEVRGQTTMINAVTGLVVYRVVQESLANIAKHAPGAAAAVVVEARVDQVCVEVRNQGGRLVQGSGSGQGLAGMRERVTTLGGTLDTGPHGDGWRVTVVLPARVDDLGVCR